MPFVADTAGEAGLGRLLADEGGVRRNAHGAVLLFLQDGEDARVYMERRE